MENFNKNIADIGWGKMKDLLDQEMPVAPPKSKKRPLLFWWSILGIAASITGLGFWFYLDGTSASVKESKLQSDSSIATQTINHETTPKNDVMQQNNTISNPVKAEIPENTGVTAAAEQLVKVKEGAVLKNNNQSAPNHKSTIVADVIPPSFDEKRDVKNNILSEIVQEPVSIVSSSAEVNNSFPSHPELLAVATIKEVDIFPNIASLEANKLNYKSLDLNSKLLPIQVIKKQLPFDFYMNAGLSASGLKNPLTFRIGAGLDFRLNKKWGIMAGLQYSFSKSTISEGFSGAQAENDLFRNSSVINPGVQVPDTIVSAGGILYDPTVDDFQIIESVGSNSIPNTDQFNPNGYGLDDLVGVAGPTGEIFAYILNGQIIYIDQISSINTIELPLNIYYKINPRLQLEAGLTASYLYRVGLGSPTYSDFNAPDQSGILQVVNTQPGNIGIRKIDIGMSVGASWQINKHIAAYGNYRQGLIDYTILIGSKPDLFRNIDLGVRYRF